MIPVLQFFWAVFFTVVCGGYQNVINKMHLSPYFRRQKSDCTFVFAGRPEE